MLYILIYKLKSIHIYLYSTRITIMSEPLYLTEYMKVKNMGSDKQLKWSGKRGDLTKKFGWTIPNKSIIKFLVQETQ